MLITDFTYLSYRELIDSIIASEYQITNYHDNANFEAPCILRHDVDFDLEKAYHLAVLEAKMNVKSTYFVLLRTNFYNIFSRKSVDMIREILSMGHEIGLHFDDVESVDETCDYDEYCNIVKKEADLLSESIGEIVRVVSFHRPSKGSIDANYKFERIENTYSKKYFMEYKYLSDSRMNWREDVNNLILSKQCKKLHICTHPFWYADEKESMKSKLYRFINSRKADSYNYLNDNFRNLQDVLKLEEIL